MPPSEATVCGVEGQPKSHYFSSDPTAKSDPSTTTLHLPERRIELVTDRGVFSYGRVDAGTKLLLLEAVRPKPGSSHLADIGCGYGPVAIAMALRCPEATVWAIEPNARARDLCIHNAAHNGAPNVEVVAPEDVPSSIAFSLIASNPPIRIGKSALHRLLSRWLNRLDPAGHADLVVQKHLGSDSLAAWLSAQGHLTERVTSRAGYRILRSAAKSAVGTPEPPRDSPSGAEDG